jgi:hypothetical protein
MTPATNLSVDYYWCSLNGIIANPDDDTESEEENNTISWKVLRILTTPNAQFLAFPLTTC